MYATCLFCNSSLGANEAIEHFPIGRQLAYDAATGRLWVVCQQYARWNLSPLETRWEAIDEAERLFRRTKVRVSTDNIAMAETCELHLLEERWRDADAIAKIADELLVPEHIHAQMQQLRDESATVTSARHPRDTSNSSHIVNDACEGPARNTHS